MQTSAPAPEPDADEISAVISAHLSKEGPLLPMLHALQERFGHIPAGAADVLAGALNISKAEIHGVISFYHDFREKPAGRHVLKICRSEACKAVGADALAEATLAKLGLDWHGSTTGGALTVEPVYCLGLCACGPAVMLDDKVAGRVNAARMASLLEEAGL